MRPFLSGIGRSSVVLALALALPASVRAQDTRVVTGVVEDAQSHTPVADVLVTIQGTPLRAVTDSLGRFRLPSVPVGSRQLVLRHVGYGEHAQAVAVDASGPLDFRVRISSRAIELSPMVVEVASDADRARRASGNVTNVIDRAEIDAFVSGGPGLLPLLAGRIPSLRVVGSCVEYRLMVATPPTPDPDNPEMMTSFDCRDITVYVDGIPQPRGSALLASLPQQDIESIRVLSPGDAGVRYADSERGVILIETRSGSGQPLTGDERTKISGFGWREPEPYPLLRVLAVSAAGNAAFAWLAAKAFLDCDGGTELLITPVRCNPMIGTGAAVATSALSGMITRKAGRTSFSEGRILPAFLIGAATASAGYVLYMHGENADSDASRLAGEIVLGVGMPLSLTFSDRVLRVLR